MSVTVAYVSRAFMVGVDAKQSEAASTQLVALFERGCIDNVSPPQFLGTFKTRVCAHTHERARAHTCDLVHIYTSHLSNVILSGLSILVSE